MTAPSPTPTAKPKRRRSRLLFIPLVLLLIAVLGFGYWYIRGTWADTEARNPKTVGDGPTSQLYLEPDGGTVNRCAVILPYSMDRVWGVVTDYAHYADFLPYIKDTEAANKDDVWDTKGLAAIPFAGDMPFAINIHEDKKESPRVWRAWWDEKPTSGQVEVNRGSWELTPAGENQTLLVLTLDAQVRPTPTFVLRNYFLYRLKQVVLAVENRLKAQAVP